MNDEIKVGEYIRTNDGYIAKVIEIIKRPFNDIEVKCNRLINDFDEYYLYIDDTTKHSPNIIDLVEEDDYVNGHLVVDIRNDEDEIEIGIESNNMINKYLKEKDIKTICTKEQFEKRMYRVGE